MGQVWRLCCNASACKPTKVGKPTTPQLGPYQASPAFLLLAAEKLRVLWSKMPLLAQDQLTAGGINIGPALATYGGMATSLAH